MKLHSLRSVIAMLTAQTQVAFNDNAAKLMIGGVAQVVLPREQSAIIVPLIAALLVLPYVVFSPSTGWLADRFSKREVLWWSLWLQLLAVGVVIVAMQVQNLYIALVGFALLALQACIFSPAKQGIMKEMVGAERIGVAAGWMEMLTVAAILAGGVGGGVGLAYATHLTGNIWQGGLWVAGILFFLALSSMVIFSLVEPTRAYGRAPFDASLFWTHFEQLADLWRQKNLRNAALGNLYFYPVGGFLYLTLMHVGLDLFPGQAEAVSATGLYLLALGTGIMVGSLLAAWVCKCSVELGLVPIAMLCMAVFLMVCAIVPPTHPLYYVVLLLTGLSGGLFVVPVNAYLQNHVREHERGHILSASNLLTNLGAVAVTGLYYVMAEKMDIGPAGQFLLCGVFTLLLAILLLLKMPGEICRLLCLVFGRVFYRIQTEGRERLPEGGALLAPNHVSYVDGIIMGVATLRPVRFLIEERFFSMPIIGPGLKSLGMIPICQKRSKEAIRRAAAALKSGELVCIFPEGALSLDGELAEFHRGFEIILREAGTPVVPVYVDNLWGSIFSKSGGRYFWKWPRHLPYRVRVHYGDPIPAGEATADRVREAIVRAGGR
ncbi:MAG: MFS transporter [Verrucomicrobiae bacterium]|nr:MFS transporter [Verrucomicrobiae bacterium]